ncbi:MAG TPA: SGNH/GDSL hydrolase family protein [Gemmatimonadaceae bacterium]
MGVQSAGVVASGQKAAWPALLANRAGAQFSLPLIQDPGCPPRLLSPLAANLALVVYILTLLSQTPTTATCADVPGAVDHIITPSDLTAINTRMAQINAHIQSKANDNGYAFFTIGSLYDLPKGSLDLYVLFSSSPFGGNISLDGVHPSAKGQAILADAAVQAINARYRLGIQ